MMRDNNILKNREARDERGILLGEVRRIQREMRLANHSFESATAPELVEACVYHLKALQAEHSYYVRMIRELEDGGASMSGAASRTEKKSAGIEGMRIAGLL